VEIEVIMGSCDHGLGGSDLRLAHGAGCLDLNDNRMIKVDQIVGRISEESEATVRCGPPRGWIDGREIFRRDRRRRTEGRVIQHRQILADRATRSNRIQSRSVLHPALAVSIGLDQTGINSEGFTTDQPFGHATANHGLEYVPQHIAVAETAMTIFGERRMVWHVAIKTQPAEPSIREVQVNLLAQPPLGSDTEAIADNQHSDQQFRIDRGTARRTIECRQMRPHPIEINEPINRPKHVVGRHVPIQRKLVKKCRLIDLPFAHHETHSRLRCLSESALLTVHKLEFFNTIGHERTSANIRLARTPN
jgi:hypothetical protein